MKRFSMVLCLALVAVVASEAWAKRVPPKPVTPLVHQGVKYVVPLDNGREGKVVALDEKTGKNLWEVVVYTVKIDPNLEEDVQWVFITTLAGQGDKLLVTNEKNQQYTVDLKTKKVEQVKKDGGKR
jgi:outer membrane protein assembly factor BamB